MQQRDLIERIAKELGTLRRAEAARALEATLEVLRERFVDADAHALADALPASLAQRLRHGAYDRDFDEPEFYERVRAREGVSLGAAAEHVQVVLSVLGALLPDAPRRLLRENLPPKLALRVDEAPSAVSEAPPAREPHATPAPRIRAAGRTLATGVAGSTRPLSESRPERAHTHSIAREDNPHGDTKLSSARGLTQEREHETLAEGHPGSERPISSKS